MSKQCYLVREYLVMGYEIEATDEEDAEEIWHRDSHNMEGILLDSYGIRVDPLTDVYDHVYTEGTQ